MKLERRKLFQGLGVFSAGIVAGELVPAVARPFLPSARLSNIGGSWTSHEFVADPVMNDQADESLARNRKVSAATAYARAANYYRASLIHYALGDRARVESICHRSVACFERANEFSGYPATPVKIPYEGTTLPGYFVRSPVAPARAPLLIVHQGRDAWPEDCRWVYDGALRRGIHCLAFHAPGQALALHLRRLAFRPDWERVITPVVDFGRSPVAECPADVAKEAGD